MIRLVFLFSILLVSAPMAAAQLPGQTIPEFLPSTPWIVGQTQLAQARGLKGVKLPCVMVAEYNNGFTMRLSGGGQKIMALAVDFRQDIFRQGARYPAVFKTDTGFIQSIKGSAFSPSILIFNMRDAQGFYGALSSASMLDVTIGQNQMRFVVSNIERGLSDLESCFSGSGNFPVTEIAQAGQTSGPNVNAGPQQAGAVPAPQVDMAALPESMDDIQGAQGQAPEFVPPASEGTYVSRRDSHRAAAMKRPNRTSRAQAMMKSSATAESYQRPPPLPMPSGNDSMMWTAREGENMRNVLERWGAQAGVDIAWQASSPAQPITQNVTLDGSFENAVQILLGQNAVMGNLRGELHSGAGRRMMASSSGTSMTPLSLSPAPRMSPAGQSYETGGPNARGQWMAPAGGSLQNVLAQWSARAGVDMQWFSEHGFTVKQNIVESGPYETALQNLLSQYQSDQIRPAARLNTDPNTGLKVLVVETYRL